MSTELTNTPMTDEISTKVATVSSIAISSPSSSDDTYPYLIGDLVYITVSMSEVVIVAGKPSLEILIGNNISREAIYNSGSGTDQLMFTYRITQEDSDDVDGISIVADSLTLNAGDSITDLADNNADLSHIAQTDDINHQVHTSTSVITSVFTGFINDNISDDVGYSWDAIDADFNNDGKTDIYVVNIIGQNNLWLKKGNHFISSNISGDTGNSYGAVTADFNGDGSPDIYVTNSGQNQLWLSHETNGFNASYIKGDASTSKDAVTADFNKDGNIDIYVINYSRQDKNRLWLGNGNGTFTSGNISDNKDYSLGAITEDFNNDGNSDIYIANYNNQQNRLWLGNGNGGFDAADISGDTNSSKDAVAADFNNDGYIDIYTANYNQQNRLWLSNGNGTFTSANISGDKGKSEGVTAADFNNDGNTDIYVANYNQQNRLWLGDGSGGFTSADISGDGGKSYGTVAADFDDDGNTDIYVANYNQQNQLWLQGDSTTSSLISITLGTDATTGSTLRLYSGVKLIASKLLTADNIATSYVFLTVGETTTSDSLQPSLYLGNNADGGWILKPGTHTLTTTITPVDSPTKPASEPFSVTIGKSNIPAISINALADSNISASEHSNDLTISGTTAGVEAGQEVELTLNGKTYNVIIDTTDGSWSYAIPAADIQALSESPHIHTITADISDVSGNAAVQASIEITHDTVAPSVTSFIIDDDLLIKGETATVTIIFSEAVTNFDSGDLKVNSGSIIEMSSDDNITWTGTFTPTDNISNGSNIISFSNDFDYMDLAANSGTPEESASYSVDTIAPTISIDSISMGEATKITEEGTAITINVNEGNEAITISGNSDAEEGQTVSVIFNGTVYDYGLVDSTGAWSINMGLVAGQGLLHGTHTITAEVEDTSSNTATASHDITYDKQTPTVESLSIDNTSLIKGGTATVTITFGEVVVNFSKDNFSMANGTLDTMTSTNGGITWTGIFTPIDNTESDSNKIILNSNGYTDLAGNLGGVAVIKDAYSIDTKAPTATISIDDTDLIKGETATVTITFSEAVAGFDSNVDLYVYNDKLSEMTSNDNITWTGTLTPTEDTTTISWIALYNESYTDAAGNSGSSTSSSYDVDTEAPTISIDSLSSSIINFNSINSFINMDMELPVISGSSSGAEEGQTVTVTLDGTDYTDNLDDQGVWNVELKVDNLIVLPQGIHTITAEVIDRAGNTATDSHEIIYDTIAPVASISFSDTSLIKGETATVIITFSEAVINFNSNVDLDVNNGSLGLMTSDDNITWTGTFTPTDNIEITKNTIKLKNSYTDLAGNHGATFTSLQYDVDTKAPTISIDSLSSSIINFNSVSVDGEPLVISGSSSGAEEEQTVTVTLDGIDYSDILVTEGTWSVELKVDDLIVLPQGTHTITAKVMDDAGNIATASYDIIQDILAPYAPSLSFTDTGNSTTDGITNNSVVEVSGLESGTSWQYSTDSGINWEEGGSDYSFTLVAGTYAASSIQVRQTDAAGNTSTIGSIASAVTVDTIAPATPTVTAITTSSTSQPTISGTATLDTNDSLSLVFNKATYNNVTVTSGAWSIDTATATPDSGTLGSFEAGQIYAVQR